MSPNKTPWGEHTKHFLELTPERILSAVESIGYRTTGRVFTLYSMENRVYSVEIENPYAESKWDQFVIAKFYRPGRWSREQILEEHQFTSDLLVSDVPVVAPLPDRNEQTLGLQEDTGLYFALYPRIGGRTPDEIAFEHLAQVGRLMGRMHAVGRQRPVQHRLKLDPATYGLANLDSLLKSKLIPEDLATRYAKLVEEIVSKSTPLFLATDMQRIHGDCHRANLLWGESGPFWIDFDDMLLGPPVQDMWLLIPEVAQKSRARDAFLKGYEEFNQFDHASLRLIEPLRALRFIHFAAWIAKRWEDPSFPSAFPNFGTRSYWNEQVQDLEEQLRLITGS